MSKRLSAPRLSLVLACCFFYVGPVGGVRALDPAPVDTILQDAVKAYQVPGLAVVIVQKDALIYLKGVGVRKLGADDPITPDSIFGIGSLTKAFTATALGILVDEEKADWDDRVRKHLPWFRLADPLADRDVTLRDLLCHRTGLAGHEELWYRATWSVEESVRRMAQLELSHSFRSKYHYNNLAYLAAGLAVGSAAKTSWQDFVTQRIFEPLEMKNAVFTRSEAEKSADHATPHHWLSRGKVEVMPWYDDDKQIRPSGSIKTSVRELGKWLRLQLNDGTFAGKRVISSRSLAETHTPQIVTPSDSKLTRLADTCQSSYGLGWHILDYRGQQLLEHGGAVDGFRARILLLPRSKLGLVLLTNVDNSAILSGTGYTLIDHLLGLSKIDWQSHYLP